jgi:hypothetical protein
LQKFLRVLAAADPVNAEAVADQAIAEVAADQVIAEVAEDRVIAEAVEDQVTVRVTVIVQALVPVDHAKKVAEDSGNRLPIMLHHAKPEKNVEKVNRI